jgi:hypothetical protein
LGFVPQPNLQEGRSLDWVETFFLAAFQTFSANPDPTGKR